MTENSRYDPLDATGQMVERPRPENLLEVRYVSLRRPVVCPHCGGVKTRIYCTKPATGASRARYHICDGCGKTFKTASTETSPKV